MADDKKLISEDRMPHNFEAERAVVGYLLQYNDSFDEVFATISANMFYDDRLKAVFSSIFTLKNEGVYINEITVKNKTYDKITADKITAFKENIKNVKNKTQASGLNQLSLDDSFFEELMDPNVAVYGDVMSLCNIIKNKYLLRESIKLANNIITKCRTEDINAELVCNEAQDDFFKLGTNTQSKSFKRADELIKPIFDEIDAAVNSKNGITGVSTGFYSLDGYTGGLQKSDMIVLAGRPGMGKTTFALNLAYNMCKNDKTVLFFSLEMNDIQLVKRIVSSLSFVSSDNIRTGKLTDDDMTSIVNSAVELHGKKLFISDSTLLTIADLRNKCQKLRTQEKALDIVFIDYLQLMEPGDNYKNSNKSGFMSRQEQIAAISRNIKALAKELNVPIVALSQLSREAEAKKEPQLSDLRESGAIEQDADIVLFINKPKENEEDAASDKTDIIIAKHRNGSTGTISLRFDKSTTRFAEWDKNA